MCIVQRETKKGDTMEYISRDGKRKVTVIKIADGYVYFRLNGINQVVNEKRFLAIYEEVKDD